MPKSTKGRFALGAAIGIGIGAIAGAITGILTAPKSGEQTRKDIKRAATNTKNQAIRTGKEVKGRVEDVVEDAVERGEDLRDRSQRAAKAGISSAKKEFNKPPKKK